MRRENNRLIQSFANRVRTKLPWILFSILIFAWIIFFAATSPDFGGTDVFIFRDAGCNFASGYGLVSESVPTNGVQVPSKLFAAYTPGAPLLFAPAAYLFGFNPYVDTYYNLFLVTLVSAFLLYLYLAVEQRTKWRLAVAFLVGIMLPSGMFLDGLDRPEAIGLVLALPLLLLWRRSKTDATRILLLGCTGPLFLIHPYLGIVEFLLILCLLLWQPDRSHNLRIATGGFVVAASTVALCAAYFHHLDPSTIHRFFAHAMGKNSGAGAVLKEHSKTASAYGYLHHFLTLAREKYLNAAMLLSAAPLLAILCNFLLLFIFVAYFQTKKDWLSPLQIGCLFCILFLFPAIVFLPQRNYFAASDALLFAVVAIAGNGLSSSLKQRKVLAFMLVIAALFTLPDLSLGVIGKAESRTTYEHAEQQAVRAKQFFVQQGNPEPRLLVDASHFFLYKQYFHFLYNPGYLKVDDETSQFDGLIRCYTGQLAFSRSELKWNPPLNQADWKLIDGDVEVERITLFGHPIQRRNWTWSCDVYERKGILRENQ